MTKLIDFLHDIEGKFEHRQLAQLTSLVEGEFHALHERIAAIEARPTFPPLTNPNHPDKPREQATAAVSDPAAAPSAPVPAAAVPT